MSKKPISQIARIQRELDACFKTGVTIELLPDGKFKPSGEVPSALLASAKRPDDREVITRFLTWLKAGRGKMRSELKKQAKEDYIRLTDGHIVDSDEVFRGLSDLMLAQMILQNQNILEARNAKT